MATAIHGSPPSADKSTARWLNFHNFLLALCIATLSYRLYTVIIGGGWEDRSQFFGDGEIRPNLIDFIYNEIFVNYLILRVIAFKYNPIVLLLVVLSAFAYFTRLPITLLFFAIIFSRSISFRTKLLLASISLALSFLVLYLRFGEDLLYADTSSVISESDVERGWDDAMAEARAHVERILSRLPAREREFLRAMAELPPAERTFSKIATTMGHEKEANAGPTSQRLDRVRGIISRGKPYTFRHRALEALLTSDWPEL